MLTYSALHASPGTVFRGRVGLAMKGKDILSVAATGLCAVTATKHGTAVDLYISAGADRFPSRFTWALYTPSHVQASNVIPCQVYESGHAQIIAEGRGSQEEAPRSPLR